MDCSGVDYIFKCDLTVQKLLLPAYMLKEQQPKKQT